MASQLKLIIASIFAIAFFFVTNKTKAQQPVLKHSYTFNDGTATDIVNGANGTIHGGAKIENGTLVASAVAQYLELPAKQIRINTYSSITIEVFFTSHSVNENYTILSYFGDVEGNYGLNYLFQSAINRGQSKSGISCKNNASPWTTETSLQSKTLDDGKPHHLVTTFDNKELKMYIDGVLTGTTPNNIANNIISNFGNSVAYLFKSGYNTDPYWRGAIDEFNIYEGVMDSAMVVQSAKRFMPGLDLAETQKFLQTPVSNLVVDQSGSFDTPVSGKAVCFVELIPSENDQNNCVDELLVFSESPVYDWDDFSAAIGFSSFRGYLDVCNGESYNYDLKIEVEIGQVYQCWFAFDMKNQTYSVYVKTDHHKKPVLIKRNAAFLNKVSNLTQWSSIYNRESQSDALTVNAFSQVDKIGSYPKGYTKSVSAEKISVFDEKEPKDALVVENPVHGFQTGTLELKRVTITNDETALDVRVFHKLGSPVSIPVKTFIKSNDNEEKLYIRGTRGMPMQTWYYPNAKGYTDVKLIFPPISRNTTAFYYGEEKGGWHMYDITLKSKDDLPKSALNGSWFNTSNGNWEFSCLDSVVIYNSKIWQIDGNKPFSKKGTLKLKNGNETLTMNYQVKGNKLLIGQNEMHLLDRESRYENVKNPSNPPMFEKPVFKMDTAILSGYYYGYDPRIGFKTGMIYVDNILTGDQENYLITIRNDGFFSVKIPLYYPHEAYVRLEHCPYIMFLEPGKEVFVLIDLKRFTPALVMGANARLIGEYNSNIRSELYMNRFYDDINDKVLDMTPVDYKVYNLARKQDDMKVLEELFKQGKLSDRYYQVMKAQIPAYYYRNILHYHYTSQSAYRKKHNVPANQRSLPVSFNLPADPEFYDFIDPVFMNDELSLLSGSFKNLINAFMYSPVVRTIKNSWYSLIKYVNDTKKFKDEDKVLIDEFLDCFTHDFVNEQYSFNNAVRGIESKFIKEYSSKFDSIKQSTPDDNKMYSLVKQISQIDTLPESYRNYCEKAMAYYSNPAVIKTTRFIQTKNDEIRKLVSSYSVFEANMANHSRNSVLKEELHIPQGLTSDIMTSQNILNNVVTKYTPLSEDELNQLQSNFQNKFIIDYIAKANETTKTKIETNKTKGGYVVNDVPNTEADKLFETIINKYKGNVVYVDFWNTWCGPCRSSMQNQKQMKEELAGKNIRFVYIANQTSPEQTYNNMIPDIKGEHYRVSQDEWNYLCGKFNISGIPHYVIVNKNGEVIDGNASRNPAVLMPKFEELMGE
ncbi:MAG: redoxin family protein [Marinilabiliaceae bacterium]|nr:redoxin family protein [Marinilabiliaceae bacterium]